MVGELRDAMVDVDHAPQMAMEDARKLRESVLKVAFKGLLVEQDPRDEPADRLLSRLIEPAQQSAPAPRGRVQRRRTVAGAEG